MDQHGDVVIVAEELRQRARGLGARRELRRPARREKLHLPPMMLHAFAPFVQVLGLAGVEGRLEALARGAVAALEPLGERAEIVGIDREPGEGRAKLQQPAHGVRCRALLEVLLGRVPALVQPAAHGLDRTFAGARLGVPLELVDGVEQRLGIARRGEALADAGDPRGQIAEDGLGHARARQQQQRAQSFEALTGAVHAGMAVRRGRQRAVSDLEVRRGPRAAMPRSSASPDRAGNSSLSPLLASKSPIADDSRRGVQGQAQNVRLSPVEILLISRARAL